MADTRSKRRYRRIGLPKGPVISWKGARKRNTSRVLTMGMGGLFIVTPDPLLAGEFLQVFFEVPGGEVRARAMVRSSKPGEGMGIEFTSMNSEARTRLHDLLSRLVGNPYSEPTSPETAT
jgi:hypothetical protein